MEDLLAPELLLDLIKVNVENFINVYAYILNKIFCMQ